MLGGGDGCAHDATSAHHAHKVYLHLHVKTVSTSFSVEEASQAFVRFYRDKHITQGENLPSHELLSKTDELLSKTDQFLQNKDGNPFMKSVLKSSTIGDIALDASGYAVKLLLDRCYAGSSEPSYTKEQGSGGTMTRS
jgi:hypothetical protein